MVSRARCRISACCLRYWPVLFFYGFGQARQFQVGISEAGAVEDVFEPGAAGDAVGIEPVALDLHHAVVQGEGEFGIDLARCEFAGY